MTKHPDLFAALAAPFDPSELKVRSHSGRQISYITARTTMNRLDNVLGPENWWDRYVPGENSVLCELTIRLPDGSTLTKCDAGGYAGMADSGDDEKSGFSDSFKRAAVKFGVARYLYRDGVPSFAVEGGGRSVEGKDEPSLTRHTPPATLHPKKVVAEARKAEPGTRNGRATEAASATRTESFGNPPRTGKALFAWTKDQEQRHAVGLLKYLNGWAKLQEFPSRMVDWDAEQVGLAYAEGVRKLQSTQSAGVEATAEALAN